ncbi:MAG TPA: LLM class flavin-dependent oxidoreductase [Actinomycetota bacterium]|nr:LLM class flavin-dependent oxidoreductase [Actinomycetota bacterium]
MKVGIFVPMEPAARSPAQHYSDVIETIVAADELGYSSVWLASRHLSSLYAAIPSPLVLLSAAASRTSRIALGTSVVTVPIENPLRLAEDFATLDAISGGRGRLGVGSGDDQPAFQAFGIDFDERAASFSKTLPHLLGLMSGEKIAGLEIYPAIENSPSKTALAAQSERGARYAGSLGIGLLQGRTEPGRPDPTESQAAAAAAYRDEFSDGWIVTARNAWIGSPSDPLLHEGLERHRTYVKSRGRDELPSDSEEACKVLNIAFGSPDELADSVMKSLEPIATDEVAITVDPGGLPAPEVIERISKLAQSFGLKP